MSYREIPEITIKTGEAVIGNKGEVLGSVYYSHINAPAHKTAMSAIDGEVSADFGDLLIEDTYGFIEPGCIRVERTWTIRKPGKWRVGFQYSPLDNTFTEWTVPSVMYDGNKRGTGKYPRGGPETGWAFREDRIPIPACSILHNREGYQAVFAEPVEDDAFIAGVKTRKLEPVSESDARMVLEMSIPYIEQPKTYTEKGLIGGGLTVPTASYLKIKSKDIPYHFTRSFYIVFGKGLHTSNAVYKKVFEQAWSMFGKIPNWEIDWDKTVALRLNHLQFLIHPDIKHDVYGIKMGKGNGLLQPYYNFTEGSFLARSLDAAAVFAECYEETGKEKYLYHAERIGSFFLKGKRDNGVHYDMYHLKKHIWGGYLGVGEQNEYRFHVNARANGETMSGYLALYKTLKQMGYEHPEYLELAEETAEFYLENQITGEKDGSFGRWWSADGKSIDAEGTAGAHIVSFLAELCRIKGMDTRLEVALQRAGSYYSETAKKGDFFGATLDADCTDKEAGVALVTAFLDLYELFEDKQYLSIAEETAWFLVTWMWTYDIPFPKKSFAAEQRVKTTGLTSVSVAHHHLDFYGTAIGYEFLRLWKYTENTHYLEWGKAMILSCTQLISKPENLLGRSKSFIGWQPEQLNHTNWDYVHRFRGTKGKAHICAAWNSVLSLKSLFSIRRSFPEIINFSIEDVLLEGEE